MLESFAQPWWLPVLVVLGVGHITNICVTLFLHRGTTHEGVTFHPVVSHFMRAWLWLTTGIVTREWVAVHRKHHAFSDRDGDPHSPEVAGFWQIVLGGLHFYRKAAADAEVLEKYGRGCPDDWLERRIYTPYPWAGLLVMLVTYIVLLGLGVGMVVWLAMILWTPLLGNVINGIGHAIGYRNFRVKDESRNIIPIGVLAAGEELHNNHHADPRSAKFKARWWEFDIGWAYIRLLAAVRLARVVYARELTAREFADRYYGSRPVDHEPVASPLNAGQAREPVTTGRRSEHAGV